MRGFGTAAKTGRTGRCAVVVLLVLLSWQAPSTQARDISFRYLLSADRDLYQVGDQVIWSLSVWVSGETRGIQSFSVSVYESRYERMEIMPTGQVPTWIYPTVFVSNFRGPDDKVYGYFTYKNYFQSSGASTEGLATAGVSQFVGPDDREHFPNALDKTGGSLCEGTFTVTKPGFHWLYTNHGSGTVWIDSYGNTRDVRDSSSGDTGLYVTSSPSASLGTTSLTTLSVIAENLDAVRADDPNGFCEEADVNGDGRIDCEDVQLLFDQAGAQIDVATDLYAGCDLTQDDRVDLRDYAAFAIRWRGADATHANLWSHGADFDRNGAVAPNDLHAFARLWQERLKVPAEP